MHILKKEHLPKFWEWRATKVIIAVCLLACWCMLAASLFSCEQTSTRERCELEQGITLRAPARYYDGCIFHRLIKGFMAQTGDPDPVSAPKLAVQQAVASSRT